MNDCEVRRLSGISSIAINQRHYCAQLSRPHRSPPMRTKTRQATWRHKHFGCGAWQSLAKRARRDMPKISRRHRSKWHAEAYSRIDSAPARKVCLIAGYGVAIAAKTWWWRALRPPAPRPSAITQNIFTSNKLVSMAINTIKQHRAEMRVMARGQ